MASASDISIHVPHVTGIPKSTIFGVKRRFVETGMWPSSRGASIPNLDTEHVVLMLLALLADVPAKDASSTATSYFNLCDANGHRLGDTLVRMIDSFKDVRDLPPLAQVTYKSRLEVDCGYPRACLSMHCTDGQEEILYGVQIEQWQDLNVRRSMTISGKTLFKIAMGVHHNRWSGESFVA